MNEGQPLKAVWDQAFSIAQSARDYIVPPERLSTHLRNDASGKPLDVLLGVPDETGTVIPTPMTQHAHGQMAVALGIPQRHYHRLRGAAPGLLAQEIDTFLVPSIRTSRLVRTARVPGSTNTQVRGFLSHRFRPLDCYEILNRLFPLFSEADLLVRSAHIDDTRMYIKLVHPERHAAVRVGDVVRAGILLQDSDVGAGKLLLVPFFERLQCLNGMVAMSKLNGLGLALSHLGKSLTQDHDYLLSPETIAATNEAIYLQARDVLANLLEEDTLDGLVHRMQVAAERQISASANVEKVVEVTAKSFQLSEGQAEAVLNHLARSGDMTQWGLANAVTRTAEDQSSYSESTRLESVGWDITNISESQWSRQFARAA